MRCDENCPSGYMELHYEDKADHSYCEKCLDPHCITCVDDIDKCVECEIGTYLLDNKCVSACPEGYREENGKCIKCNIPNCKKCNSKDE